MKTLNNMMLALGVAALAATSLCAQTKAVAKIPFDFTVQAVTLPAGDYTLQKLSTSGDTIQIVNNETRKSVLVMAPGAMAHDGKPTDPGKVIFHQYGDRYFLSEVWTPSGLRGRVMPNKLERELTASNGETQMASVSIPLAAAQ